MGAVFREAMRRTTGSGNAPNVVDKPTRAVGLTCSMTSARDANSEVVSFRIKYFLCEASFPATTSARECVISPLRSATNMDNDQSSYLGINEPESLPSLLLAQAEHRKVIHHLLCDARYQLPLRPGGPN
jgi:hypothetical protein